MSFTKPADWERQAKDICDFLGVTKLPPAQFRRLAFKLSRIQSDGADHAYARIGRGLVNALTNIENILAQIKAIQK